METKKTMALKNLWVFLVAAFALVLVAQSVSAFGNITAVEINGVDALTGINFANFAGQTVDVHVSFLATSNAEDVRIKAWFSGERENAFVSERFDVIAGSLYTRTVRIDVPSDLDNELDQSRTLEIVVENRDRTADEKTINVRVQRESYNLQILSLNMQPEIRAGESLAVDVVLKNRGSHFADDTFLVVRIPQLGLETRTYFGDLSALDQSDPDKEDAVERRTYLRIPMRVTAGLYTVELEAFNSDSVARAERRVLISGVAEEARVISSATSKSFAVGETAEYKLTVVNRGTIIGVYNINADAPTGLNVEVGDPVIVVPAGSSKTVSVFADASESDNYSFTVDVTSEDGAVIDQEQFRHDVVKNGRNGTVVSAGNTTLLLTVVLAIVFIVLLVVLIVLLTRKPETKEEFGESYY